MKKIIIVMFSILSLCIANTKNTKAQQKPPIRNQTADAQNSNAAKALQNNSICEGLASSTPTETKSSSGAIGYYSVCKQSNTVIFYLMNQKISVLNYGNIRTKYATQDYERGSLGFPLADQQKVSGVWHQDFEGGIIYSYPVNNVWKEFIVSDGFYTEFKAVGGEKITGKPIADVSKIGGVPLLQKFENGVIAHNKGAWSFTKYGNTETQPATAATPVPGEILPTTYFIKDHPYLSADKRYGLVFQSDGNLVLYKTTVNKAIWSTKTAGIAIKTCVFQNDGNLVLYGYNGKAVWDAFTTLGGAFTIGGPKSKLEIQNDGNLVIYACNTAGNANGVTWSSHTTESN